MPWTFAHPAAVLPLRRVGGVWLSFPALVLGSLLPDLGYYTGQLALASRAHTLAGLWTICLPSGLVLLVALILLRVPLTRLLPQPHRALFLSALDLPRSSPRHWAVLVLSLLLGALTHQAWDAFTHGHGAMVAQMSWLRVEVAAVIGRTFHVYHLLQHGSTVLGVLALTLAYRRVCRDAIRAMAAHDDGRDPLRRRLLWGMVLAALLCAVVLVALRASSGNVSLLLVRVVVYASSVLVLLYAIAALIWHWHATRH